MLYNNGFSLQLISNLLKKRKLRQPPNKKENFDHKQIWATFTFFGNKHTLSQNVLGILHYVLRIEQ